MSEPNAGYAPCPTCGALSLAQMSDHLCPDCADTYVYCPVHANRDEDGT